MKKSYSLNMLTIFLILGSVIGLILPFTLRGIIPVSETDFLFLQLLALGAGWILGAANYAAHYIFLRHIIGQFRTVLGQVREEDYSARINLSSEDMLGLLAEDVNATLSHLEDKNDEVQHDDLTQLPNRQFLKQYYRKHFQQLANRKTAFLFFDLDKFKDINDQYGHLYGDRVLVEVAKRVQLALEKDEFLIRLSGDEFLFVATMSEGCTDKELAEKLMTLFTEPFDIYGTLIRIQVSIGVSSAPLHGDNLTELIRKADFAMYEAKKTEGLAYYVFEEKNLLKNTGTAEPVQV